MRLTTLAFTALLFTGASSFTATGLGSRHRLVLQPQQQRVALSYRQQSASLFATIPKNDERQQEKVSSFEKSSPSNKILGQPIPYSELTIGVIKETYPGENRVSQSPDSVRALVKAGFNVMVQAGGN